MIRSVDTETYVRLVFREGEDKDIFSPKVFIGESSEIGPGCQFRVFAHDRETITIGEDCAIADNVFMVTNWGSHYVGIAEKMSKRGSIVIGSHVWIGHGAMIRGGVAIGDYAIIGMGTVITKNVSAFHVVVGNPARDIGERSDIRAIV